MSTSYTTAASADLLISPSQLAVVKSDLEKARADAAEAGSAKSEHSQRADVAEAKLSDAIGQVSLSRTIFMY